METLDKLYLELSLVSKARNAREVEAKNLCERISRQIEYCTMREGIGDDEKIYFHPTKEMTGEIFLLVRDAIKVLSGPQDATAEYKK